MKLKIFFSALLSFLYLNVLPQSGDKNDPKIFNDARIEWISDYIRDKTEENTFSPEVREFYRLNEYEPRWFNHNKPVKNALILLDILSNAEREGLNPSDYDYPELTNRLLRFAFLNKNKQMVADIDLALSAACLNYALHLHRGNIRSGHFYNKQELMEEQGYYANYFHRNLKRRNLKNLFEELTPKNKQYSLLKKELDHLLKLKKEGMPAPPAIQSYLKPGDTGEEVNSLKQFLYKTGDLISIRSDQPVFDERLERAVMRYQRRHGLVVDGIIGEETIREMNTLPEVYINKVKANMDRLRIMPFPLPQKYISVNLPEYRLHYFENGTERGSMKIIIGDIQNETPMLLDTIEYLVFSPKWYVPAKIAREELFPKILNDTAYASEMGFEVFKSGKKVSPDSLYPEDIAQNAWEYRLEQQPGPHNALGRVKFIFPNQRSIYLHDTPADYLFDRDERHLSHGCVRVENPVELSRFVLNDPEKYPIDSIISYMHKEQPYVIYIERKIPVLFRYQTAWVDRMGDLNFRKDIYGFDR